MPRWLVRLYLIALVALLGLEVVLLATINPYAPPRNNNDNECVKGTLIKPRITGDALRIDNDKDGLSDEVELVHDSRIFGNDPKNWPHPYHSHIFLEIDTQAGYLIPDSVKNRTIKFYDCLPYQNPDGTTGIRLHIDDASEDFYFEGGQLITNADAHLTPYITMVYNYQDAKWFDAERCGVFHYGIVFKNLKYYKTLPHAAGLGESPGDRVYFSGEDILRSDYFGTIIIVQELGHNILGQLDRINWDGDDTAHDPYGDFMSHRSYGSQEWAHDLIVAELQRDGFLGLPHYCSSR